MNKNNIFPICLYIFDLIYSIIKLNNQKIDLTDSPYSLNTWYHLSVTWDGNMVKLYRNGILTSQAPFKSELLTVENGGAVFIGADLSGAEKYAAGQMDDIRIWNVALSQDEIRDNMHILLKGSELGLAGYWKFDEGSGDNLNDSGSNTSKGTLINGIKWIPSGAPVYEDK